MGNCTHQLEKVPREIFRIEAVTRFRSSCLGTTVEVENDMSNHSDLIRTLATVIGFVLLSAATARGQSADAGQKVYPAQKCSICHSIAGAGNKKGPLDGVGKKLSAEEIRQWITDAPAMAAKAKVARKPPMKAYKLAKEDLDGLVAYMQSLK